LTAVTGLFFIRGFLTCLNDILVPHLKAIFSLNYAEASLVPFCFFGAYFIMSLPSGMIVARWGYRFGMIAGLVTTGLGAWLFHPAATLPSYPFFLAALFVPATGVTLLQVSANPYISTLGNPATASSRLNPAQAFDSPGTTLAGRVAPDAVIPAGRGIAGLKLEGLFIHDEIVAIEAVPLGLRTVEFGGGGRRDIAPFRALISREGKQKMQSDSGEKKIRRNSIS
jgi:FHS family L-fucose permease-like MFS transporter